MTVASFFPRPRLLLALASIAMVSAAGGAHAQPAFELADCRLDGVSVPARCGSLTVFEDRAAGAGRTLDLEIVVIPAVSDNADPDPLFFLAGGPGQAATDLAGPTLPLFADVRRSRDLVFVDQRGTGGSGRMRCAFFEGDSAEEAVGESLQFDALPLDELRECLAEVEAGADPRQYTTPVAMDDLDAVRAALGYERINLYGGSYGTRAALVYMRRHPDRVRTAVLDGLAPVAMRLPTNMNADAHRALDRLFADCAADPGCREAFPDLPATFAAVLEELEANPRRLDTTHPRTGEPFALEMSAVGFAGGLRNALYNTTLSSLVPWTVTRAAAGDFAPFLAQLAPLVESGEAINVGMFLSVVCAEDVARLAAGEAERMAGEGMLGRLTMEVTNDACSVWPAAELPDDYFEPVRSAAPALLLSGDLDPVTPPRWGETVMDGLTDALHVVAPGAGHGVLPRGCTRDVVAEFIEAGTHAGLDASCIERLRRPPFLLSAAGTDP
ncbi:MAG: alpha/beta fold hydrolase [Acidobacteria bacterium]|nr:alpha/beta fold hydrolase [Acidobacteriota bacterium]